MERRVRKPKLRCYQLTQLVVQIECAKLKGGDAVIFSRNIIASSFTFASCVSSACLYATPAADLPANVKGTGPRINCTENLPQGAAAHGYYHNLICERPEVADISYGEKLLRKYSSGAWFTRRPAGPDHYSDSPHGLSVSLGGELSSVGRDGHEFRLPLLEARNGFYVEFAASLSDSSPDHFPALWLMPLAHDPQQSDHSQLDPTKFERWVELDVDEGGFTLGRHNVVINWQGVWPKYNHETYPGRDGFRMPMDRSRPHIFGVSYDPRSSQFEWWIDGKLVQRVDGASFANITDQQKFYILISAKSQGKNVPYEMVVSSIRAYGP